MVAMGGALGSVARYVMATQAARLLGGAAFGGTLVVNVIGSVLMGLLAGWLVSRPDADLEPLRLILGVGFLGGFTTFSAYSLDVVNLIEGRSYGLAITYGLLSVLLSVAGVMAGLMIARRVFI